MRVLRAFTLIVLSFSLTSLFLVAAPRAKEPRVKGDRLVFSLPDLDGEVVASSDARFEGKVVFVTIWGTWCPPCRTEIPTFNDLHERYADVGLVIVGIAFERDSTAAARQDRLRAFSTKHEIQYLVLDGGATSDFADAMPMVEDVKGLPIEIFIDRRGTVVKSRNGYGYKKKWAKDLEKDLKRLLEAEQ